MSRHPKHPVPSSDGAEPTGAGPAEDTAEESETPAPDAPPAPAEEPDAPALPPRVRLLRPHGFIDGHGQNRHWAQGEVVGDPAQVGLLLERGAHVEPLSD